VRWVKNKDKGWIHKAFINGLGALVTGIAVIIIGATKFVHGAWIVVILIPILVSSMLRIKKHYAAIAKQLRIETAELSSVNLNKELYRNRVIVPIASINKASVRALKYAKTISDNITAFNVYIDEEDRDRIERKWKLLNTDIPLIVRSSPYRKIISPLLEFIESTEYDLKKGDIITVHTGDVGTSAIIGDDLDGSLGFATIVSRIKDTSIVSEKYICHYLNSKGCKNFITSLIKGDRNNLNLKDFNKIKIPVPSIQEQQRIIDILDRFDALYNDITTGLPAEIEARTKQYEYCRDKLLTFKELS
jgi:hypothetical protein